MEAIYLTIKSLLLPPGLFVLLMLLGFITRRLFFIILTLLSLYLLSTSYIAGQLMSSTEPFPALTDARLKQQPAEAIVVLGGGRLPNAPEYAHEDVIFHDSLFRTRYAAYLFKKTGLTVYASGGNPYTKRLAPAEAELIKKSLTTEFGLPSDKVKVETKSKTTFQNAEFTALLLKQDGIKSIYLVSNTWHLPRAVKEFKKFGFKVIPAPTVFFSRKNWEIDNYQSWLPSIGALKRSRTAMHEWLGQLWYSIKS